MTKQASKKSTTKQVARASGRSSSAKKASASTKTPSPAAHRKPVAASSKAPATRAPMPSVGKGTYADRKPAKKEQSHERDARNRKEREQREFDTHIKSEGVRMMDSGYMYAMSATENDNYVGYFDADNRPAPGTRLISLTERTPNKGTKIKWKDGTVQQLPEKPSGWAAVTHPVTNEPLIPAEADPAKQEARKELFGLKQPETELERVNRPGFDREAEAVRSEQATRQAKANERANTERSKEAAKEHTEAAKDEAADHSDATKISDEVQ